MHTETRWQYTHTQPQPQRNVADITPNAQTQARTPWIRTIANKRKRQTHRHLILVCVHARACAINGLRVMIIAGADVCPGVVAAAVAFDAAAAVVAVNVCLMGQRRIYNGRSHLLRSLTPVHPFVGFPTKKVLRTCGCHLRCLP